MHQVDSTEDDDSSVNSQDEIDQTPADKAKENLVCRAKGRKRKYSPSNTDYDTQSSASRPKSRTTEDMLETKKIELSRYDSDLHLTVDEKNLLRATPLTNDGFKYMWGGVRSTVGFTSGKVYFEAKLFEELQVEEYDNFKICSFRMGCSVAFSSLQLGETSLSYGYDSSGKKVSDNLFKQYGKQFKLNDVVTCLIDFESDDKHIRISFALNENEPKLAFQISKEELKGEALYPHFTTRNISFGVKFGDQYKDWNSNKPDDFDWAESVQLENRIKGPMLDEKTEPKISYRKYIQDQKDPKSIENFIEENRKELYYPIGQEFVLKKMTVFNKSILEYFNEEEKKKVLESCRKTVDNLLKLVPTRRRNYILLQDAEQSSSISETRPCDDTNNVNQTSNKPNEKKKFNLSASNFGVILETDCFIDKTLLIKEVLENEGSVLVTCPRRFGKTTNADMLKKFLTINVDEEGNPLDRKSTKNYRTFTEPLPRMPDRKLAISNHPSLIEEYLGNVPVIFVNSRSSKITSFQDAKMICREIVHNSFLEHGYLKHSSFITKEGDKETIRKWCSPKEHKNFDENDTKKGLKELSRFLFLHFNRRSITIVDEYDNYCFKAMITIKNDDELKLVIDFFLSCLDLLLKDNDAFVRSGFVTGISYICTTGLSTINNIEPHKFLDTKLFKPYYGLFDAEINDLQMRFDLSADEMLLIKSHYNGYGTESNPIYSIYSVLNYLNQREVKNYWTATAVITNLSMVLTVPKVRSEIGKLLSDHDNVIEITNLTTISLEQVCCLKEMLFKPDIEMVDCSLYFNFLAEQGYFNIKTDGEKGTMKISIPNLELATEFRENLMSFYREVLKLDVNKVLDCANCLDTLNFDGKSMQRNSAAVKKNLRKICIEMNTVFKNLQLTTINEACFHHVLFVVGLHSGFKCSTEFVCKNKKQMDILLLKDELGIIFELKFDELPDIGLKQIIENRYHDVFKKNAKNFCFSVNHFILIGMSINQQRKTSISWLIDSQNMKNKNTFCT